MTDDLKPAPSGSGEGEAKPPVETKEPVAPEKPTEPAKPEGGKKDEPAKPAEPAAKVVPEKYDLKLPDGSILEAPAMERVAAIAKERGLSNEEAQALLDQEHTTVASLVEANKKAWFDASKADKEIGGDAFPKNAELAKRVVERFGTDALKSELNKMGYGNHPELVRLLTRIGKTMSEDQLVMPGTQSGGPRPMEDVFYPQKNQ